MELVSDRSFLELAEERRVGDRPEVIEVVGVQTRLFEDWSD